MEAIVILVVVYLFTLIGLTAGIKRGYSPDTMVGAAFLLGPLCGLMALSDARQRIQHCKITTTPTPAPKYQRLGKYAQRLMC